MKVKKKVTLIAQDNISFQTAKNFSATAASGLDLDGGPYANIKGDIVRIGPGATPVARRGDLVRMGLISAPIIITFATPPVPGPNPATITTTLPFAGSIATGQQKVLV
jgi:hypothetical protein